MKRIFSILTLALAAASLLAANVRTTVEQVSTAVTLDNDVDYVVTSATPFTDGGYVNIANTEHAVLILQRIRPSVAKSQWLRYVRINGASAVDGSNCQVKMYAHGTIILPYGDACKPLTVYSEPYFEGTAVNSFGLENSGGYMNTLTEAKLNNKIYSFKLKRGYMVTFSTRKEGRGYSRCFIADTEDLEVATLPNVLNGTISSYRVFKWQDAQKKGLASDIDATRNGMISSSWCYDWGTGHDMLPDVENVPNHIYEDWPSSAACGSVTYACHMKTNNEPGNSADDHPQSVETVLANWENLMRTGLRLCSESSHDGSWSHLRAFIDSIDARGWRCDLLDLHCYWPSGNFNNWKYYYDTYGQRPIWISEWVWGASWNNNGIFATDRTYSTENQQKNANELMKIIPWMNASPYVERYAYWNSEADCSKIIKDNQLSIAGEYYASVESGIAYRKSYEKIPTMPRQYGPSDLTCTYDKTLKQVTLKFHDKNGEFNQLLEIQCKKPGSNIWSSVLTVEKQEDEADYTLNCEARDGYKFRVHLKDLKNKDRYSNEVSAVSDNIEYGDEMQVGEQTMYLGGNHLLNGSFDLGLTEWTNGLGEPLAAPYFQAVKVGGMDGGSYLHGFGTGTDRKGAQALRVRMSLEPGTSWFVSAAGCNNDPQNQRISTTSNESFELYQRVSLPAVDEWAKQGMTFTVATDTILLIQMRNFGGVAQMDEIYVCQLFATREEALADAMVWEKLRAAAFARYNTLLPELNATVLAVADTATMVASIEEAIAEALAEINDIGAVTDENVFSYVEIDNGNFANSSGWTKTSTYTGGDQRLATQAGKSCWNAWWSSATAAIDGKNMGIEREVNKLYHGRYALEVKATTQHYCESDQHGYLSKGEATLNTRNLPYGVLDIPSCSNAEKWVTLNTPYIYVNDNDTIKVGFVGTKSGAADGSYIPYGNPTGKADNREGWWCATDFRLRYVPEYRTTVDESGWGTLCLQYTPAIPEGVTLYRLVGVLDTHAAFCFEEVSDAQPATPYIFHAEPNSEVVFEEQGNKVTFAQTVNGLRGVFTSVAKYTVGSFVLEHGQWRYIPDTASRFPIASWSAYVRTLDKVPVLSSWEGLTLPTQGIEVGLETVGIDEPSEAVYFNLQGQRVATPLNGIFVRNGKKVIIR